MEKIEHLRILNDDALDQQLLALGYVVVPFLNKEEVNALLGFYADQNVDKINGIYASAHVDNKDFRIKVNNFIKQQFARAIDSYFHECEPLGGSFIVKGEGEHSTLYPHQDWNIVDESKYRSFNIWIPLVDVYEENGAVSVLEESHLKLTNYRGANIPCEVHQVYDELWPRMKVLNMKAGEALIYDHRLIHASRANQSGKPRIASVYGIIPKAASMKYYYKNGDLIEEYDCNQEFYVSANTFAGPAGLKLAKSIPYHFPTLNAAQFRHIFLGEELIEEQEVQEVIQKTATTTPEQKTSLLQRIKSFFGG